MQRLLDAGAIPIGKTNLDQFATGLVGVRSPYGACRNSFDPAFVSGGSSSGSAVSVAKGWAGFSLGTDTAGSGRVPASFNNLVGHKPTCGLLSATGMVPACRSLDTISVFTLTAEDAQRVLAVAAGFDAADPFSRKAEPYGFDFGSAPRFRFGVPRNADLEFFGNKEGEHLFRDAVETLRRLGGEAVEIDLQPFLESARLLYGGPWVAERYAAIREFFDAKPQALFPVTREIVAASAKWLAADAYSALYRLKELKRIADQAWGRVDCIVTPTAPRHYRSAEVEAHPIKLNSNLGYYTNFMNLLDYAATAVPVGFQADGLPWGVTLFAPAFQDVPLLRLGAKLQRARADRGRNESAAAVRGSRRGRPHGVRPGEGRRLRLAHGRPSAQSPTHQPRRASGGRDEIRAGLQTLCPARRPSAPARYGPHGRWRGDRDGNLGIARARVRTFCGRDSRATGYRHH